MKKLLKQGRRDKQKGAQLTAKENPRGITLIALVVTIVVLLILAGITINLLFSEGGILEKAQLTENSHKEAVNSDWEAINDLTDKINGLVDGTGSTGGGSEGGDNEGGDTGGGGSEGGSSGVTPDESWKELTLKEREEKLKQINPVIYLFYDGDEPNKINEENGHNIYYTNSGYFNTIGYAQLFQPEATCECKQVKNIYKKAEEMGLIKTYDNYEYETVTETDSDGTEKESIKSYGITAEITEPSLVYYSFACHNSEQLPGGAIPQPYSLNYEVSLDGGDTWLDADRPHFDKTNGGDYETALVFLGKDYVEKLNYTMMKARIAMMPAVPIISSGQTAHYSINVLTQTDFMKAAKELNLDLSSYNCIHPNK